MSEIDEKKNKIEDLDERLEELENKIQNIEDILDIQDDEEDDNMEAAGRTSQTPVAAAALGGGAVDLDLDTGPFVVTAVLFCLLFAVGFACYK